MNKLEVVEKIRTFENWRNVPHHYGTKIQWLKRGRRVNPNEKPTARWISTVEADPNDAGEVWLDDPDFYLLVDREILLYHIDQTKPANFKPRSIAYLGYEEIFYELARKDRHILREESWLTIISKPGAAFYWASNQLSRQTIRQHVNGSKIVGVMSAGKTRFLAIDHDFHGNDRDVFLEQSAVLLNHFHGWGTWHYQVRRGEITGMHYILTFDSPKNLKKVLSFVRKRLVQLDQEYPDLAFKAKAAGMPSFAKMEIFPQSAKGFRLPLCQGYEMLLDRPLPLVMDRGKMVQDVVGYMNWLNEPSRKYMTREDILNLLCQNLGPSKTTAPVIKKQSKSNPKEKTKQFASEIGSMKGCCRQKVVGFWSGDFNPRGSLNAFLVMTARIFCFEGISLEEAVRLLREYVEALPNNAQSCSQRLLVEDWSSIEKTICNDVETAYSGNGGQQETDLSTQKLSTAVACWQKIGFKLSDKSTWSHNGKCSEEIFNIKWSEDEAANITQMLGAALGKKHAHLACDVATAIVSLVTSKYISENGIGYDYWATFLNNNFGIACKNRNKIARIIKACVALGLIRVHCKAIWGQQRGMATIYRPGGLARSHINKED